MKTLLLVVLLAWPIGARADNTCALLWDMAVVARALAEDKLPQDVIVRVLGRIYSSPIELSETLAALALADHRSAVIFAGSIRQKCEVQIKPPQSPGKET